MIFFSRHKGPLVRGDTPGEKLLRFIVLLILFLGIGWLFWKQSEHSMDLIMSWGTINDRLQLLSKAEREKIYSLAKDFKSEFGLILKIEVTNKPFDPPTLDSKTVYLGLNPQTGQAALEMPILYLKALGPDFPRETAESISPRLKKGAVFESATHALTQLWNQLMSLQKETRGETLLNGKEGLRLRRES